MISGLAQGREGRIREAICFPLWSRASFLALSHPPKREACSREAKEEDYFSLHSSLFFLRTFHHHHHHHFVPQPSLEASFPSFFTTLLSFFSSPLTSHLKKDPSPSSPTTSPPLPFSPSPFKKGSRSYLSRLAPWEKREGRVGESPLKQAPESPTRGALSEAEV